jgi:hypothetical protein
VVLEMDKKVIDYKINNICEAYGCFEKAVATIKVRVGKIGSISLHLCSNCIRKFDQKEMMLEQVDQPLSNTKQSIQPLSMQGAASTK